MPITFTDPALQSNEMFKSYETPDDLAKAFLGVNTKVTTGGIDLLPDDLQKDPSITPYKTIADVAKGLVETKKMLGGIEKAPEKPDGYKFTALSGLHPSLKSEEIQKALMPLAHASGVGNKAADMFQQGLLKHLSGLLTQQEAARKELALKNETALRTEWGGEYDAKLDKITKTLTLAGGPDAIKDAEAVKAALKGSPTFLKTMGKLIGFLSEDSIKSLGEGSAPAITDATAAQAEIKKYTDEIAATNGAHDYYKQGPAGEAARKKMADLFALCLPK